MVIVNAHMGIFVYNGLFAYETQCLIFIFILLSIH